MIYQPPNISVITIAAQVQTECPPKGGTDSGSPGGCRRHDMTLELEDQERSRSESEPSTPGVIIWTGRKVIIQR